MRITFSTKPLFDSEQVNGMCWAYNDLVKIFDKLSSAQKVSASVELGDTNLQVHVLYYRIMGDSYGSGLKNIKLGRKIYEQLIALIKERFPDEFKEAEKKHHTEQEWNKKKTGEGGWP